MTEISSAAVSENLMTNAFAFNSKIFLLLLTIGGNVDIKGTSHSVSYAPFLKSQIFDCKLIYIGLKVALSSFYRSGIHVAAYLYSWIDWLDVWETFGRYLSSWSQSRFQYNDTWKNYFLSAKGLLNNEEETANWFHGVSIWGNSTKNVS